MKKHFVVVFLFILISYLFPKNSDENQDSHRLTSIQPIGIILGSGISSIVFENYLNNKNEVNVGRWNLWGYFEGDANDAYAEFYSEFGLGFGVGSKKYLSNASSFRGLYYSYMLDSFIVHFLERLSVFNQDRYFGIATLISSGGGFSIPIGKLRLEPAINISYALTISKKGFSHNLLTTPQLNIGYYFIK